MRLFGIWLLTRGVNDVETFIDVNLDPVSDRVRDNAGASLVGAALAIVFLLWTRTVVH